MSGAIPAAELQGVSPVEGAGAAAAALADAAEGAEADLGRLNLLGSVGGTIADIPLPKSKITLRKRGANMDIVADIKVGMCDQLSDWSKRVEPPYLSVPEPVVRYTMPLYQITSTFSHIVSTNHTEPVAHPYIKDVKLFGIGVDVVVVAQKRPGSGWVTFVYAGFTDIHDGWLEFPKPFAWLSGLMMIPIDVMGGKVQHLGGGLQCKSSTLGCESTTRFQILIVKMTAVLSI